MLRSYTVCIIEILVTDNVPMVFNFAELFLKGCTCGVASIHVIGHASWMKTMCILTR
jgi:hypothetical protein